MAAQLSALADVVLGAPASCVDTIINLSEVGCHIYWTH